VSLSNIGALSEKRSTVNFIMLANPGITGLKFTMAAHLPSLSPDSSRFPDVFVEHQCAKREEDYRNFHNVSPNVR